VEVEGEVAVVVAAVEDRERKNAESHEKTVDESEGARRERRTSRTSERSD
jgi:hypothetical protein